MPSLLWVTAEVPDRDLGGGNIRQYHLLSAVSAAFEVDLVVAGTLPDDGLRPRLRDVVEVEPAPPRAWPTTRWRRRIAELTDGIPGGRTFEVVTEAATRERLATALPRRAYDVVVVVHAAMAPLADRLPAGTTVLELQNLASARSAQYAEVQGHRRHRFLWERDARRAARLEAHVASRYDQLVVCSDDDAAALPATALVVPNGVEAERFPVAPLPSDHRLVFTGSFNYPPNADAAVWLCDDVLPRVRAEIPDAELSLVGREPMPEVVALAGREGVRAAFDVPSVAPELARARVAMVPVRAGSGTRLKALEAMAAGRPVVGTAVGLAGLGLVDGRDALVRDDGRGLAAAVVDLLLDDDRARAVGAAGRQVAVERFGWSSIGAAYTRSLLALATSPSTAA